MLLRRQIAFCAALSLFGIKLFQFNSIYVVCNRAMIFMQHCIGISSSITMTEHDMPLHHVSHWHCIISFKSYNCDVMLAHCSYAPCSSHCSLSWCEVLWYSCLTLNNILPAVQLGKTALHEAAIKGSAEMVDYMMEQVNPNVDARDMVSRALSTATNSDSKACCLCQSYVQL